MKRILILYTNYGTGHYMAAKAIEEHINNNYSEYSVEVFDPLSYSRPLINKLFAKTGKIVATKFRGFRKKLYGKKMYKNFLKNSLFFKFCLWLFWTKKLKNKLFDFNADIIISTQVGPTGLMAAHKEELNIKLISVFTDYGIHRMYTISHEFIDLYCVPSYKIKKQMIDIGINKDKVVVTGIPVFSRFLSRGKADKESFINKYALLNGRPVFLFVCGGGLGYDNAFSYFEELLNFDFDFSYVFVSGKNKKLFNKAAKLAGKYKKRGIVLSYIENMDEFMMCSDIIFGKPGGIITSEALNVGIPFCAIAPIPGQEVNNALFIEDNKCGFYIRDIVRFREFLNRVKNETISIDDYKKNIKNNFSRFSFVDLDKV